MIITRFAIEYEGGLYDAALVEDRDGSLLTVATDSLFDAMCPNGIEGGFKDEEARMVDETIFGYVFDEEFSKDDSGLMTCIERQWEYDNIF